MDVLEDRGDVNEDFPYVVHNVPLIIAAELGILAAVVVTSLLGFAAVQAWRAGPGALLLYVAVVPLLVLDVIFYNRPLGLFLFATWAGVLAALGANAPRSDDAETLVS